MHAGITSETVSLVAPNNVAVSFCHRFCSPRRTRSCPLSESDKFPNFLFSYTDCHSTSALIRTLQIVSKRKNIQFCQVKFFQQHQHKYILSLNFLVYSIIFPPLYMTLQGTAIHSLALLKCFESIISITIIIRKFGRSVYVMKLVMHSKLGDVKSRTKFQWNIWSIISTCQENYTSITGPLTFNVTYMM